MLYFDKYKFISTISIDDILSASLKKVDDYKYFDHTYLIRDLLLEYYQHITVNNSRKTRTISKFFERVYFKERFYYDYSYTSFYIRNMKEIE